jgi:multisubunit Na+/H+ antiporter MnhG subunit
MAVDLHTPRGRALVLGVMLALLAIILHFSVVGATTSYGFWLMGLAYVVTALFGTGLVGRRAPD